MEKGDRVEIIAKGIKALEHRKNKTGKIVSIDGEYVLIRPSWCKWEIELYRYEIKVI